MFEKKILFITCLPAFYRMEFFNELGKNCELTVLFTEKIVWSKRDASYFRETAKTFRACELRGFRVSKRQILFGFSKIIRQKYDHIILADYASATGVRIAEYMIRRKIPYGLEIDGAFPKEGTGFRERLKKRIVSRADFCFSSGPVSDRYFLHYGADAKKIVHYNFSSVHKADLLDRPLTAQQKTSLKTELGVGEPLAVITVGAFIHRKGIDVLLKACAQLPASAGLYVIGGEPTEAYLESVERYALKNVHFISYLDKETLKKYYRACDLFVLPTRYDIWGLVVNEAMAQGLPVITTRTCIAGLELIQDGVNGYLYECEDADALARNINAVLTDASMRTEAAKNNLEKIKDYTIEGMAETHLEFFRKFDPERA